MADPVCCCLCFCLLAAVLIVAVVATASAAGSVGSSSFGGEALGSAPGGAATVGSSHGPPPEQALQSFALLNQLRADGFTCPGGHKFEPNTTPLRFDCALFRASQMHSEDMARNGFLSNFSPSGTTPQDRAEAEGIPATGENVARGQSEAYEAIAAWKASEGACRNMMDPAHKLTAVGFAPGADSGAFLSSSGGSVYWTQIFADSSVSVDQGCVPDDMQQFGHSSHSNSADIVGKVGKTWRLGDTPPATTASTTNPTGGFKFTAMGQ